MGRRGPFGSKRKTVPDSLKASDCFEAILRGDRDAYVFISPQTGKPYAVLDPMGLHVQRGSGKAKEKNTISLKTLEVLMKELKRA